MGRWNVLFGERPQTSEVGNWISWVQLAMPFSMRIVWCVVNYFPRLKLTVLKFPFVGRNVVDVKSPAWFQAYTDVSWVFKAWAFAVFGTALPAEYVKNMSAERSLFLKRSELIKNGHASICPRKYGKVRKCLVFCLPLNSAGKKPEGFFQGRVWQRCLWDPDLVCACQWRRAEEGNQRPMTGYNILVSICFNIGWSKVHLRSIRSIRLFVCPAASEFNDSMVRRWTTVCFGTLSILCPAFLWLNTSLIFCFLTADFFD